LGGAYIYIATTSNITIELHVVFMWTIDSDVKDF